MHATFPLGISTKEGDSVAGKQVYRSFQGRGGDPQVSGTTPQPSAATAPVVVPLRVTERHSALLAMGQHPMFSALAHDQLQRLLNAGRTEHLDAGQVLYSRDEASTRFFLVLEGQVNLSLHSRDGVEKIIDIQGPGQVFAEAVAFMARPVYQLTATAASAARVLGIPNQDYVETLLANPKACRQVLQHLSSRLHLRIREIEGITLESATSRVARLLDGRMPAEATDTARIRLTETRQELASYLAMKPETLSRALRVLADNGAVVVQGRTIDVVSRVRLRSHLDDAANFRADS
jgi:CRP/FNR family transcriptional regulator, dissimilatory nitrate respiration regulator